MKQTKCHECWGLNGHHWNGCKTRGYAAIGPHPDAPALDTEPAHADPTPCPCGIARLDCEYHRDSLADTAQRVMRELREIDPDFGKPSDLGQAVTHVRSACGQYVQTYRGGKLVDEEPAEVYLTIT